MILQLSPRQAISLLFVFPAILTLLVLGAAFINPLSTIDETFLFNCAVMGVILYSASLAVCFTAFVIYRAAIHLFTFLSRRLSNSRATKRAPIV